MNTVKDITGDEYLELVDCYGGLCLSCLEFKYDGCEPDAEGYHCDECGEDNVVGIENALIMERLNFTDGEEE